MKVIHNIKNRVIEKEGEGSFFVSDRNGGYLSLDSNSQYQGWFTFLDDEWELFKILEDIRLVTEPETIIIHDDAVERIHKKGSEKFLLKKKALIYSVKGYNGPINLQVDFRRIHDYSDSGRVYEILNEQGTLIIHYSKYSDNTLSYKNEDFFLAIKGKFSVKSRHEWIEKNYPVDEKRKTVHKLYVYNPFFLKTNSEKNHTIVMGFGKTKQEAINNAKREHIKHSVLTKIPKITVKTEIGEIASNALENLTKNLNGSKAILAGLPWFYQAWSRDELISLVGLIEEKRYSVVKNTLLRYLNIINEEGTIGNRYPASDLASADGIGWLFKRAADLLDKKAFSKNKKEFLYKKLCESIEKTRKHKLRKGLVWNEAKETWMDTNTGSADSRAGFRAEIQALHLNMYKLAKDLSKKGSAEFIKYSKYESDLKHHVIKYMCVGDTLKDGLDEDNNVDYTVRPNVFLAYYIYPELLSNSNWKKTFDKVIEECWLNWGGFSSISKYNSLYQANHTGIDNKSYHRGDSWYYINNIAATCLHKLDKKIYKQFIEKIIKASTNEMLFSGFFGQCAEISSAETQTSEGCLAQAWSAATLIELLRFN